MSHPTDLNFRTLIDGINYFPNTVVDLFIANTMDLKDIKGITTSKPTQSHGKSGGA
jgi:hypothetical protein